MIIFAANVELAADNRLDSLRQGLVVKVSRAENVAVIGYGNCRHVERFDALHQLLDVAGAIQQRVIGMQVEMNEIGSLAHRGGDWFHSSQNRTGPLRQ